MKYDVFISHASADKSDYVNQLKTSIDQLGVSVFYDKDTIEWGDNWKEKLLNGIKSAEFAIIVISENFFGREWTEKELHDFLDRQNSYGQKIILPILHGITNSQLKEQYPFLADIQSIESVNYSCDQIALQFARQFINRLKDSRSVDERTQQNETTYKSRLKEVYNSVIAYRNAINYSDNNDAISQINNRLLVSIQDIYNYSEFYASDSKRSVQVKNARNIVNQYNAFIDSFRYWYNSDRSEEMSQKASNDFNKLLEIIIIALREEGEIL